jgi:aminoglycoside/choline kinase family phosphotransferase
VLEDFGDALFPQALAHGADEAELYETAGRILAHLHAATPPCELAGHGATWPLQDYDALALKANADLFVEWLPRASEVRIDDASRARWESVRDDLVGQALAFDRAFTIRDYHAENLIWLPERTGLRRVGLLDFQDAVRGWRAWDLSMLLHDARRDVSPLAVEAALQGYIAAAGAGRVALERELAVLGAINSMRILGIFSRLAGRDGKTRYLAFMPRMWGHLARTLNHPALQEARTFVHSVARPYLEQAR